MLTLETVLEWNNLRDAWDRVADNGGAAGADAVSIGRYARYWGANLHTLRELVRAGRYRPGRLRRVAIPKRGGGQRILLIPTVADRVLQRAVLNVLDPVCERIFLPCSHGYRPRRGVRTALKQITALHKSGLNWVLDADIEDCFPSIDHGRLRTLIAKHVQDAPLRALLECWLGDGRAGSRSGCGLAQGMPTSPLLCNLYLHELDRVLARGHWPLVRYADDFIICCASEREAEQARTVAAEVLGSISLRLKQAKTRVTSFDAGFEFLGIRFQGNSYSFMWEEMRFVVEDPVPGWLWGYLPEGYDG